jgi:nucleotide-binding universal stress UspA family protein
MRKILVSLTGFESDAAALDTAYLVGRLFDSQLHCICARPAPGRTIVGASPFEIGAAMNAAELIADLQKENELRTRNARLAFDRFCKRWDIGLGDGSGAKGGVSATWQQITGDEVETTIAEARYHDLVVVGRPAEATALSTNGIGAVLVSGGRPLLVAPETSPENIAPTIAIAWKEGPEAARAITAAAPLLARAARVVVLTADEGDAKCAERVASEERVAAQLRRHGVTTEARLVVPGGRNLPDAILESARATGADIVVMGGYGHSRLRELVFGGFTRHVLEKCPLPVFLFH